LQVLAAVVLVERGCWRGWLVGIELVVEERRPEDGLGPPSLVVSTSAMVKILREETITMAVKTASSLTRSCIVR